MARAATRSDVFNAIGEPRRRQIMGLLALGAEWDVSAVVRRLGLPQPSVSKHLGVLRQVGLVTVHSAGRRRLYRLDARPLRPVAEWLRTYEQFWADHLSSIKTQAERRVAAGSSPESRSTERADDR